MTRRVSKAQAHELLEDADFGVLVAGNLEFVPVIGSIDTLDDLKLEAESATYKFGTRPNP